MSSYNQGWNDALDAVLEELDELFEGYEECFDLYQMTCTMIANMEKS